MTLSGDGARGDGVRRRFGSGLRRALGPAPASASQSICVVHGAAPSPSPSPPPPHVATEHDPFAGAVTRARSSRCVAPAGRAVFSGSAHA